MKLIYFLPIGVTPSANISSLLIYDNDKNFEFLKDDLKKVILIIISSKDLQEEAKKIESLFKEFLELYSKCKGRSSNDDVITKIFVISDENDINKTKEELKIYFEEIKNNYIYTSETLDGINNVKILANVTPGTKAIIIGLILFLLEVKKELPLPIELIYIGGKVRNKEGKSIFKETLSRCML